MKYLLKIKYDGKDYYGWAPQPSSPTIFYELKKALLKVFEVDNLILRSSSRTDRYVHAEALPATIEFNKIIEKSNYSNIIKKLNNELPNDIQVFYFKKVDDDFEVRFGAKKKKYRYFINTKGNGDENYCLNWTYKFDYKKFKKDSKLLIGKKDFASFTGKSDYENTEREVFKIKIKKKKHIVIVDVIGSGFLRFMVRNIVGSLLALNRGAITMDEFNDYLINPVIGKTHNKARGSGLYLINIKYK